MKNFIIKLCKKIQNKVDYRFTTKVVLHGKNNSFIKNSTQRIYNSKITILGSDNTIILGNYCNINGLRMLIEGENNKIKIGKNVIINASNEQPTVINAVGENKLIKIGDNSMLSNNIEIHTTDYHGIYNFNGKRINPDSDVLIGKHVWIGLGVKILKGTQIADGCIIGAGSVLTNKFLGRNNIIAGDPAIVIKKNVFWNNGRKNKIKVPSNLKN